MPIIVEQFAHPPDDDEFHSAVLPIAELYQLVYGVDSNWNEGKKCPQCRTAGCPRKFNLDDAPDNCPGCENELVTFWPIDQIIEMIARHLKLPHASCVTARDNGSVVGCAWGFAMTPEKLVEQHLNRGLASHEQIVGVTKELAALANINRLVAYGKDMAVHPDPKYRIQGIGKQMFRLRHETFRRAEIGGFSLRTLSADDPEKAAITYRWWHLNRGIPIVGQYPHPSRRVILADRLHRFRC